MHRWADQLLLQLLMEQFDTLPIQCRHTEHMHEGVWFTKNNFDKMTTVRTLRIQCRHIEHMHEGVYNFCLHRFY